MEIYLLLFAIPFLIFILGFILAIVNLRSKKLSIEVIAWACTLIVAILNTILFFNSSSLGIFPMGISDSQVFAIPIYVTFFLLLQYRSNEAKDIQIFRIYYALKSFCLIQILGTFISFGISWAYSNESLGLDRPEIRQMISYVFSGINLVFYSVFLLIIIYRYFKITTPPLDIKSMFMEGFVLAVVIGVLAEIWNLTSLFLRFHSLEWFSITYLFTIIFLLILESALGAWLGAYIYINKSDKNSA